MADGEAVTPGLKGDVAPGCEGQSLGSGLANGAFRGLVGPAVRPPPAGLHLHRIVSVHNHAKYELEL